MKTTKKILIVACAAFLTMPLLESCKKGENDPGISFKSRAARVVGEWILANFDYDYTSNSSYTAANGDKWKEDETGTMSYDGTNVKGNGTTTETDADGDKQVWSNAFDGGAGTMTNSYTDRSGSTTTTDGGYTHTMTTSYSFVKDGTFKTVEDETVTTVTTNITNDFPQAGDKITTVTTRETVTSTTTDGAWSFMTKNKSLEYKNKERLALTNTKSVMDETTTTTTVTTSIASGVSTVTTNKYVVENSTTSTYTSETPDEVWSITQLKNKEMMAAVSTDSDMSSTTTERNTPDGAATTSDTTSETAVETGSGTMTLTQE